MKGIRMAEEVEAAVNASLKSRNLPTTLIEVGPGQPLDAEGIAGLRAVLLFDRGAVRSEFDYRYVKGGDGVEAALIKVAAIDARDGVTDPHRIEVDDWEMAPGVIAEMIREVRGAPTPEPTGRRPHRR